ncbi:multicopper oxidase family protein [Bacillus sp. 1P06AnD]|uniref:multicopper oxidase family protein n=1 Tax=Bacillus sp. 1P06AnD TaxID=3132208 RepID=UPI0039A19E06
MKKRLAIPLLLAGSLTITACSDKNDEHMEGMDMSHSDNSSKQGMNMEMGHNESISLKDSTGENELNMPAILKADSQSDNEVTYTVDARQGQSELFKGTKTNTLGYNGSFMGPVLKLKKGQNVHIKTKNSLQEDTTFHWHGLEVAGSADGGPHNVLKPGTTKELSFKVEQPAATLWFHPHVMGKTAKQVFNGLAGLIYIEDDQENKLNLPNEYGKNDIPLIIQDKAFTETKQLNYDGVHNSDGTTGDTTVINGTVNPRLTVDKGQIRLRLLNGSNARNYTFKLSNGQSFNQIASDGGLLNEPVSMKELKLGPAERAEIIVDFSNTDEKTVSLIDGKDTVLLPIHFKEDTHNKKSGKLPGTLTTISLSEDLKQKPIDKKVELFGMGNNVTINGKPFDMNRIDFTQKQGITEIWEIYNKPDHMGGMIHPFHIHGTQFKVVSINGKQPPANEQGYKDTVLLDPGDRIKLAVSFPHKGIYMYHCHILEHEENGMMGQIKVE